VSNFNGRGHKPWAGAKQIRRTGARKGRRVCTTPRLGPLATSRADRAPAGHRAALRPRLKPLNGRRCRPPPSRAAPTRARFAAELEEFATRGFAAARLEDVAARAGVGKGTIYLHFRDKEALFQELVTTLLVPFIANLEAVPPAGLPIRTVLEHLIDVFLREIY